VKCVIIRIERRKEITKMRYFVNIITGALVADFIEPTYRAYWKEITKKEYDKLYEEYYR